MTSWLIKLWIVAYLLTVASALWERRWPWALYYTKASLASMGTAARAHRIRAPPRVGGGRALGYVAAFHPPGAARAALTIGRFRIGFGAMIMLDVLATAGLGWTPETVIGGLLLLLFGGGGWVVSRRNGKHAKSGNDKPRNSGCPKDVQAVHATEIASQGSSITALQGTCEDIKVDMRQMQTTHRDDMREINGTLRTILGRLPK